MDDNNQEIPVIPGIPGEIAGRGGRDEPARENTGSGGYETDESVVNRTTETVPNPPQPKDPSQN